MAFLGFHLDDALAEKFAAMAATEGGKSALMRRLVQQAMGNGKSLAQGPIATGVSRKVTIRLTESELHLLATVAAQRGMNRTQWIASLVRARLGFPVQQTRDERQALRAVARELNRIGGNINQIAHAANLNRLIGQSVKIEAEAIREASARIEVALAELRVAVRRNADYWQGR
ncbi:plasmid mobilization relaxosome protein MobC [Methylocystis sp. B8]|uniref:plasmid mobilization protein n=1 Tax=Methylocystis sp. B8 TaxID=544938 RepID=UPI0010FD61FA|nr:plasmid mobilization relaxosome protein MobC [Methylocystis sp. B8]TLG71885.1 MobC family plasmid mobilization relaxosome protein [Methylocystis sp. B8]